MRVTDIERVEVLRGPGSSLYGDTSMGGVIQVFTRPVAGGSGGIGELRLSNGTLGTRSADLFFRSDVGPLRIGADGLMATTGGYRNHASSRDSGGDLTLQHLGDTSRLQLTASLSSKDRQAPGPPTAAQGAPDRPRPDPPRPFRPR